MTRRRFKWEVALVLLAAGAVAVMVAREGRGTDAAAAQKPPVAKVTSRSVSLPLVFEPNLGQATPPASFVAHGSWFKLLLSPDQAVFALQTPAPVAPALPGRSPGSAFDPDAIRQIAAEASAVRQKSRTLKMRLLGANPNATMSGLDRLPGKTNYFIGRDRSKWRSGVPNYAKVRAASVYPGIDVVYHERGTGLDFDLILAPGADPRRVKLAFDGVDRIDLDSAGDAVLRAGGRAVTLRRPVIYQGAGAAKRLVGGRYRKRGSHQIEIADCEL